MLKKIGHNNEEMMLTDMTTPEIMLVNKKIPGAFLVIWFRF